MLNLERNYITKLIKNERVFLSTSINTMSIYPCPKPVYTKPRRGGVYIEPSIWDLRKERGEYCEWCEYLYSLGEMETRYQMEQRHHCLVGDLARYHAQLTTRENLMGVCMYHHTGTCELDCREVRIWFWGIQCQRYGVDYMQKWLKSLPGKLWQSGRIDRAYFAGEMSMNVNLISVEKGNNDLL